MSTVHGLVSVLFHAIFAGEPMMKFSPPFGTLTTTTGGTVSSSVLTVTVAWLSAIVALVAFARLTKNDSSGSFLRSPLTEMVTVLLVTSLAGHVTVPLWAW